MKITIVLRCIVYFVLLLLSASSGAAIIVTPNPPHSTQNVHIQVITRYPAALSALTISATVTRSGNRFIIDQKIELICPQVAMPLPTAPILTSDFDVGILPAGTYQVVAQFQDIGRFGGCGGPLLIQNASFNVSGPIAVPTGNGFGYLVFACLLAGFGARRLWISNGYEA